MKLDLFQKEKDSQVISVLKNWAGDKNEQAEFFAPGALIYIQNGKGLLREVYGNIDDKAYVTLMFADIPLFEMQGDEYFCPTCEKIVRSGYVELDEEADFRWEKINQDARTVSFDEVIEEMKPLLGLLKTGFYVVIDTKLHPTDGNGHFFWDVPGNLIEVQHMKGSCSFQFDDFEWADLKPFFMIGTQSQRKCNMERVNYYRQNPGARAIAYYMDGYMTALIDGHHKSYAAALDGKDVNALVICPTQLYWKGAGHDRDYETGLRAFNMRFSSEELGIDKKYFDEVRKQTNANTGVADEEMIRVHQRICSGNEKERILLNVNELVKFYPDVMGQAYIDRAGEITDKLLDDILKHNITYDSKQAEDLIQALGALQHPRLFEIGDFFLSNYMYERKVVYTTVKEMMKCERTPELEQYFINIMVELEEYNPQIKDLILGYF